VEQGMAKSLSLESKRTNFDKGQRGVLKGESAWSQANNDITTRAPSTHIRVRIVRFF
jgi:hypothetical protein